MATTKEAAKSALDELKRIRDEIRVKLHLANMEVKDRWNDLEPKLENLEKDIEGAGETVVEATGQLLTDVGKSIRELGDKLKNAVDR
jgi:hypothetical protein